MKKNIYYIVVMCFLSLNAFGQSTPFDKQMEISYMDASQGCNFWIGTITSVCTIKNIENNQQLPDNLFSSATKSTNTSPSGIIEHTYTQGVDELTFSNVSKDMELLIAEFNSINGLYLRYLNHNIKVGDPISVVQTALPDAYAKRGKVDHVGSAHAMVINVDGVYITIEFFQPSGMITQIRLWQPLT